MQIIIVIVALGYGIAMLYLVKPSSLSSQAQAARRGLKVMLNIVAGIAAVTLLIWWWVERVDLERDQLVGSWSELFNDRTTCQYVFRQDSTFYRLKENQVSKGTWSYDADSDKLRLTFTTNKEAYAPTVTENIIVKHSWTEYGIKVLYGSIPFIKSKKEFDFYHDLEAELARLQAINENTFVGEWLQQQANYTIEYTFKRGGEFEDHYKHENGLWEYMPQEKQLVLNYKGKIKVLEVQSFNGVEMAFNNAYEPSFMKRSDKAKEFFGEKVVTGK